MTRELHSIYDEQTVSDACALMQENQVRPQLVLNREGGLQES